MIIIYIIITSTCVTYIVTHHVTLRKCSVYAVLRSAVTTVTRAVPLCVARVTCSVTYVTNRVIRITCSVACDNRVVPGVVTGDAGIVSNIVPRCRCVRLRGFGFVFSFRFRFILFHLFLLFSPGSFPQAVIFPFLRFVFFGNNGVPGNAVAVAAACDPDQAVLYGKAVDLVKDCNGLFYNTHRAVEQGSQCCALSMGRPGFNRTQPSGSALASVFTPFHTPIMEIPSGLAVKMAVMVLKSNTGAI